MSRASTGRWITVDSDLSRYFHIWLFVCALFTCFFTSNHYSLLYAPHQYDMSTHASTSMLLAQVTQLHQSHQVIRNKSPVIQQWPWDNGIPLQHGSMVSYLKERLGEAGNEPVEMMTLVSDAKCPHLTDTCILAEIC